MRNRIYALPSAWVSGSVVVEFGFEPNDITPGSFASSSLVAVSERAMGEERRFEVEVIVVDDCPFQAAILNGWLSQNLPSPAR